jgi:hypothetical protein
MNNTKNYYFHINIEISTNMEASSKKEAIKYLKDLFEREHNLTLTDEEIKYTGEDKD